MIIAKTVEEIRQFRKKNPGLTGFVPTMGFLHQGHISLVEKSVSENEFTVASIYVNPTQFGPNEDLDSYPSNIDNDLKLLEKAGCNAVFLPDNKVMYPDQHVFISIKNFSNFLCGLKRPGHFDGVLTVVAKLFNIILPDNSYFGEKDYQQLLIIKKLVKDLNFPVNISGCPTIREKDGVAMSSRNSYLDSNERAEASALYKIHTKCREIAKNGMKTTELLDMLENFQKQILNTDIMKKDYVEIRNQHTLEFEEYLNSDSRIFLAFYCGKTRLIDNAAIF